MSPPRRTAAIRTLVIVLAAATAAGFAFKPAVLENLSPKNFGEVDPGRVYRSAQLSPAQLRAVHERHRFKTIIDFGSFEPGTPGERRNQRTAEALGITRYVFDLEGDATGNPNWYAHALAIMTDPARQPVLVHCGAGAERTGCAVILYNALVHEVPIETGYRQTQDYGHSPGRNPRLRQVLDQWSDAILTAARNRHAVEGADPIPEPGPAR